MAESQICLKSELDLFALPPTQMSVFDTQDIEYQPLTGLTDEGPVEFFISGEGERYIDLTKLKCHIKCKIVKKDGTDLTDADFVVPESNLLHNIFGQIDVTANDKLITPSTNTYSYTAFLDTLFTYSEDAGNSHLQSQFWYKDNNRYMDQTNETENKPMAKRLNKAKNSKTIDMLGTLHLDLAKQERLLPNNVSLKIRMVRNSNMFCLRTKKEDTTEYKIHLIDVSLFVRKVEINDKIREAHENNFKHGNMQFPLRRTVTKVFTESANALQTSKENLYLGQLPNRIVVGLLDHKAYYGHPHYNPFNFQHFYTKYIALQVNGKSVPGKPYTPNFDNGAYIRSYIGMKEALGLNDSIHSNNINYEDFGKGSTLWVFDLTPDGDPDGSHLNPIKHGNIRLELHFARPLAKAITVLVQGEFQNVLEIDQHRNVVVDFAN